MDLWRPLHSAMMWDICLKSDLGIPCQALPPLSSSPMAFCLKGSLAQLTVLRSGWGAASQLQSSSPLRCPFDPSDTFRSFCCTPWEKCRSPPAQPNPTFGTFCSYVILSPSQLFLVAWQHSNKTDHHSPTQQGRELFQNGRFYWGAGQMQ